VAQVALQQGRYVGRLIERRIAGRPAPKPFSYFDKGNMAVVGRNFSVLEAGHIRMSGFIAWMAWALIHILFLAAFGNRLRVITQWVWTYISQQRGSRLILSTGGKAPLFDADQGPAA
jgi:NADH dehydrogenase FAD-containing subunit